MKRANAQNLRARCSLPVSATQQTSWPVSLCCVSASSSRDHPRHAVVAVVEPVAQAAERLGAGVPHECGAETEVVVGVTGVHAGERSTVDQARARRDDLARGASHAGGVLAVAVVAGGVLPGGTAGGARGA